MADAASRPSPLAHGVSLLPHLAKGRNLGEGPSSPAREGTKSRWTTDFSQRGYHRQPEREDDGKRGPRGYDAGKKVTGRKRHIIVDTIGLLLAVVVHPADIQDRDGAKLVINKLLGRFPRLRLIWADAGYAGQLVDWVMSVSGWALEIVRRPRDSHQFCSRHVPAVAETWTHPRPTTSAASSAQCAHRPEDAGLAAITRLRTQVGDDAECTCPRCRSTALVILDRLRDEDNYCYRCRPCGHVFSPASRSTA